jgi:hypothetical protein
LCDFLCTGIAMVNKETNKVFSASRLQNEKYVRECREIGNNLNLNLALFAVLRSRRVIRCRCLLRVVLQDQWDQQLVKKRREKDFESESFPGTRWMVQNASKYIDFLSECYILDSILHLWGAVRTHDPYPALVTLYTAGRPSSSRREIGISFHDDKKKEVILATRMAQR